MKLIIKETPREGYSLGEVLQNQQNRTFYLYAMHISLHVSCPVPVNSVIYAGED